MRIVHVFLPLFLFMLPVLMFAEAPFSFTDTPGKLPKDVVPLEYSIRIVPYVDNLVFAGSEEVKLEIRSAVHQLVINALELEITEASIDGKSLPKSAIRVDKQNEL